MNRILIALVILPLVAFSVMHKFYVSVTQINYIEDKKSVQITSRVFVDDMENALRGHYDEAITLAGEDEPKIVNKYLDNYLEEKLLITINGNKAEVNFLGKEYDGDIMRCYLEIENVNSIKTFEVSNQVLFELFEDQQNIVKTKIYSTQKSEILTENKPSLMLKFN